MTRITIMAICLAGTAFARADVDPPGNLLADPDFDLPPAAGPWVAASGSLDDMFCTQENCDPENCGYTGVLHFPARETGNPLAVQQSLSLPPADVYRVLIYYPPVCNGAPIGQVKFSLSGVGEAVLNYP